MEAIREYGNPGGQAGAYSQSISPRNALTKKELASLETYAPSSRTREKSLLTMPRGTPGLKHGLARQQLSSRITR